MYFTFWYWSVAMAFFGYHCALAQAHPERLAWLRAYCGTGLVLVSLLWPLLMLRGCYLGLKR